MLIASDQKKIAKKLLGEINTSTVKDQIDLNKHTIKKLKKYSPGLSELERIESADGIVKKLCILLREHIEICCANDITPKYEFSECFENTLVSYSKMHDEPQPLSFLRKHKDKILKLINLKMSWESFEHLCKHILINDGIEKVSLAKKGQEGIDFYGVFKTANHLKLDIIPKNCKIKVVGQVKRYKRKIKPGDVRAFKTYCDDIMLSRDVKLVNKLPTWFKNMKCPVVGIFMTTSDYTKRALEYPTGDWKILRNGQQIVELIIKLPEGQNWITERKGLRSFDGNAFLETFQRKRGYLFR